MLNLTAMKQTKLYIMRWNNVTKKHSDLDILYISLYFFRNHTNTFNPPLFLSFLNFPSLQSGLLFHQPLKSVVFSFSVQFSLSLSCLFFHIATVFFSSSSRTVEHICSLPLFKPLHLPCQLSLLVISVLSHTGTKHNNVLNTFTSCLTCVH